MAAEAEAVRQRRAGLPGRGLAEHEVDGRELGVDLGGAGGGREQPAAACDSTTATASIAPAAPSEWPVTPFTEVTGGPGVAEELGQRLGLGGVVERRRRAVGVDVADVGGRRARRRRAPAPCTTRAAAAGRRGGDVVGVRGATRRRAPRRGSSRPVPRRRPTPRARARPRPRRSRSRRARRRRAGTRRVEDSAVMFVKPAMLIGRHRRLGAAGDDGVAAAARDPAGRVDDGVGARRAGRAPSSGTGPANPSASTRRRSAALGIIIGTRNGDTRRAPLSTYRRSAPRACRCHRCRWR